MIKDDFDKLQKHRWNFKYGFFTTHIVSLNSIELLDDISIKLKEIMKLNGILEKLLNSAIQEAIGLPGEPADLEKMVYASKQFASLYERIVAWALYFKTLQTDEIFKNLLQLLYELPKTMFTQMDDFVDKIYTEITKLPDVKDDVKREIKLSCVLDEANIADINSEIERLYGVLC
ncbi:hypothetical protein [[Clostridium] hylemonae]|uniref:hypothetical protein n=1 Tax=[Clostridium] hylemonae TaxID=89153 RepID=UPI001D08F85E|nr:hypothetical protein [[Clostridium] hylemonae]